MADATDDDATKTAAPETRGPTLRIVPSTELLQGAREIIIRHGTDDYRLRLTRVGKLILNK